MQRHTRYAKDMQGEYLSMGWPAFLTSKKNAVLSAPPAAAAINRESCISCQEWQVTFAHSFSLVAVWSRLLTCVFKITDRRGSEAAGLEDSLCCLAKGQCKLLFLQ